MLAKLVDGNLVKESIIHKGDMIIVNPSDEEYKEAGYKEVEDNRLPDKDGYYLQPEYTEKANKIVVNYKYVAYEEQEDI